MWWDLVVMRLHVSQNRCQLPPLENCPQTGSLLDSQSLLFIIYNGGVEIYPNIVETSVCMIALLVHYTIWAFEAKIIASRMFSW